MKYLFLAILIITILVVLLFIYSSFVLASRADNYVYKEDN